VKNSDLWAYGTRKVQASAWRVSAYVGRIWPEKFWLASMQSKLLEERLGFGKDTSSNRDVRMLTLHIASQLLKAAGTDPSLCHRTVYGCLP